MCERVAASHYVLAVWPAVCGLSITNPMAGVALSICGMQVAVQW